MKRLVSLAFFGVAAALLGGCPVYSGDGTNGYPTWASCRGNFDCPSGTYCDANYECTSGYDAGYPTTDATAPATCTQPGSCPPGYTCSAAGACQLGDCSVTGCVAGYVCELENGVLACVPASQPVDASPPAPDAGTDSGVACQSNADCASTPGALCLDGQCVPPPDQCYDGTQCPAGDKCVEGVCTPTCQVSADGGAVACPTGYACSNIDDASNAGVCSGNPTPCESNPGACAAGTVCSQNHCVAPCGTGSTCPTGEQCLQGGCVPVEVPKFICGTDGVQDACAAGSICIHHSCYIACSPDAGASGCQSADQFNECKPVAASGGTYYVCGSSSNLGSQCSPTQSCASSAAVCIDGFCH